MLRDAGNVGIWHMRGGRMEIAMECRQETSSSFILVLYAMICNIRRLWLSVNTSVLVIFLNILKREVWLPEAEGEGNDTHFLTFPDASFSGSEIEAE